MCSIFGSFSRDIFIDLARQNQYRGSFSYSVAVFDPYFGIADMVKDFGKLDINRIPDKNCHEYYIGHVQAPTGGLIKDYNRIHPCEYYETYLWHNGILKSNTLKKLQSKFDLDESWDTRLLHYELHASGFDALNDIDGSFGCVYINHMNFYMFTSDIVRIFIDDDYNISSTKFPNSTYIEPNVVFNIGIEGKGKININKETTFNSKSSPYYFGYKETSNVHNKEKNNV